MLSTSGHWLQSIAATFLSVLLAENGRAFDPFARSRVAGQALINPGQTNLTLFGGDLPARTCCLSRAAAFAGQAPLLSQPYTIAAVDLRAVAAHGTAEGRGTR